MELQKVKHDTYEKLKTLGYRNQIPELDLAAKYLRDSFGITIAVSPSFDGFQAELFPRKQFSIVLSERGKDFEEALEIGINTSIEILKLSA